MPGPAGFFIIRGGPAGDKAVLDSRFGTTAVLPGPAPQGERQVPAEQDLLRDPDRRSRTARSTPTARSSTPTRARSSTSIAGPVHPGRPTSRRSGTPSSSATRSWSTATPGRSSTVEQRRYRFRFLNGCQSRFLILDFDDIPGVEVWQIGNEGGFLAAPVNLTADHGNRLLMGLAERADLIVDFTNVPRRPATSSATSARTSPSAAASRASTSTVADPDTTGQVMQFRVVPRWRRTRPRRRSSWCCRRSRRCQPAARTRPLALLEEMSMFFDDAPAEAMLGTSWHRMARRCDRAHVGGPVTENPARRRHRGLGVLQRHRRRPPDARPRGGLRGRRPAGDHRSTRTTDGHRLDSGRPAATAGAVGERVQGHRHRLSRARSRASRLKFDNAGPVRLALPHRRARGQRDDAALPHRAGAARPAGVLKRSRAGIARLTSDDDGAGR